MNTAFDAIDFSVAMTNQLFSYDSKTGVIRLKSTGCKIGNLNTADGGTRIECNGKTLSGARVAWIIETGNTIPPALPLCAVSARQAITATGSAISIWWTLRATLTFMRKLVA
ncbi:putative HNH endonuclease [Escherichia phage SSL-2009a]|uniref:HNH endonuclease n=1 Tax=Escherichia phage SSL-2009a TaxID=2681619 RepID=T2DR03_9CAUD|nr:putative HNH endonuclease [Escherichia phage SSL-2009a]AGV55600.1 putative HNH endonuclease [Escherichia phage SSL-2009a]